MIAFGPAAGDVADDPLPDRRDQAASSVAVAMMAVLVTLRPDGGSGAMTAGVLEVRWFVRALPYASLS